MENRLHWRVTHIARTVWERALPVSSPVCHIVSRNGRPGTNKQLAHRAVLAQQQAAGASNTVSDPEAHVMCQPLLQMQFHVWADLRVGCVMTSVRDSV